MNMNQVDYLLGLLHKDKEHLNNQYQVVLKNKQLGINYIDRILEAMQINNNIVIELEKMKKEVDYGVFGLNH
jgi:hypothetical protein